MTQLRTIAASFLAGALIASIFLSSQSGIPQSEAVPAPSPAPQEVRRFIPPAEVECLAKTIYFEARNESLAGQLAVGLVVINRLESDKFPKRVCAVVEQGRYTASTIAPLAKGTDGKCQFSWYCDGQSDLPKESKAWERSKDVARVLLERRVFDFTDEATHYHAAHVSPRWAKQMVKVGSIDSHTFYKEK